MYDCRMYYETVYLSHREPVLPGAYLRVQTALQILGKIQPKTAHKRPKAVQLLCAMIVRYMAAPTVHAANAL